MRLDAKAFGVVTMASRNSFDQRRTELSLRLAASNLNPNIKSVFGK